MDSLDKKVSILINFISWMPSPIKIAVYRLLGADIGKNVKFGLGSVVAARSFKKVRIGDYSCIGSFSVIACDEIELGEDCHIGPFVWVYGGSLLWMIPRECKFKIGKVTYIGARCTINVTRDISIGDYTGIGGGTMIYTHGFQSSYIDGEPRKEAPVEIGSRVWIQPRCIILPGVSIGHNSIIGTGSVVTKDVPPDTFSVGCPSKSKSDVNKLKKSNSIADREARTLNVISDYLKSLQFLKKSNVLVKEIGGNAWSLTVKRFFGFIKTNYSILYVRVVDDNALDMINRVKDNVIFISLSTIESDYELALNKNNILWLDLTRKLVKNREGLPPMFYQFIRDYYGEGLVVVKYT